MAGRGGGGGGGREAEGDRAGGAEGVGERGVTAAAPFADPALAGGAEVAVTARDYFEHAAEPIRRLISCGARC